MPRLWTPPKVDRGLADETRAFTADMERMLDRTRGILREFTRDLKAMDPDLELVFFDPDASGPGIVPGRYHVLRKDRFDGPPTLIPIVGPNGEFAEPDSGLFDYLRKIDLWNTAAARDRERAHDEARKAAERAREREQEERHEELVERWKAATETRVSMNDASPWSQNRTPAGRRDAGSRKKKAA
jgi:hypothetical protein